MSTPDVVVRPPRAPFDVRLRPPGSKSLTNRALILAAVASGTSTLTAPLDAADTRLCVEALRTLGVRVEGFPGTTTVEGRAGPLGPVQGTVYAGTAGTVARFLLAVAAAGPHPVRIDGSARMRERPMDDLVEALRSLGRSVRHERIPGALPLSAGGPPYPAPGGRVVLTDPKSSQFASALALCGPLFGGPLEIRIEGVLPARPYFEMTVAMLAAFGARVRRLAPDLVRIEPGALGARALAIEPDASAASYFLAAAAAYGGRVTIEGLGRGSLQGDARFVDVLAAMGAEVGQDAHTTWVRGTGRLRGVDVSLADMPDLALTLAVLAVHAVGPTRIRGVEVVRHHESDRLEVAARELPKLGAKVVLHPDGLEIVPPAAPPSSVPRIATYDDHRVAMAFALGGRVAVSGPDCTEKTYPGFFSDLARLGMVEAP